MIKVRDMVGPFSLFYSEVEEQENLIVANIVMMLDDHETQTIDTWIVQATMEAFEEGIAPFTSASNIDGALIEIPFTYSVDLSEFIASLDEEMELCEGLAGDLDYDV
jgi:hypothetical protein